jgi:hypothetical protein
VTICGYSIVDGIGARSAGNAHVYTTWLFLLDGLMMLVFVLLRLVATRPTSCPRPSSSESKRSPSRLWSRSKSNAALTKLARRHGPRRAEHGVWLDHAESRRLRTSKPARFSFGCQMTVAALGRYPAIFG